MALYVDSAFLEDIANVVQSIPLAGVTTNPTILLAARERGQRLDPLDLLRELLNMVEGNVFMQPGAVDENEMLAQALSYIEVDPLRVIPKLPMTHAGMRVALHLKKQKRRVAFTAVTSVAQAYTAAMAHADFIIPYYNRLERSGIDADERIGQMAGLFGDQHISTRILAASIKSTLEAESAFRAHADDITAVPQVLLEMISDEQTDEAVKKFAQDWQKLNEG